MTTDYNSQKGLYFDAGLAIVAKEFEFSNYIRPICLPTQPVDTLDYLTGDLVTLTGYGTYSTTNLLATELKFINLKVNLFFGLNITAKFSNSIFLISFAYPYCVVYFKNVNELKISWDQWKFQFFYNLFKQIFVSKYSK